MDIAQMFREAGVFGYIEVFAFVAAVLVISLVPKLPSALPWALAALPMVFGAVGYFFGLQAVYAAIAHADPSMKAVLLAQGTSEAMQNLKIGGVASAITFVVAIVTRARSS